MTSENRKKLGLALSGGGVRGFAHVGVLKLFEREGIPIDCIVGTSAGGIVAGAYAAGLAPHEFETEILRVATPLELIKLLDVGFLQGVGLITGERVSNYLSDLVGAERTIEQLNIPFATNAVCLDCGEEIVIRDGSLVAALRSTMSVPGVFAPFAHESGCRLVDGGILNNLPVNLARELEADVVVAVDIALSAAEAAEDENDDSVFKLGLANDLWQTVMIMTSALTTQRMDDFPPDVLILPQIPTSVSLFSGFNMASEIIQAGVEAAEAMLPQVRALLD